MYLDVADWQNCTKSPQISTLPHILLCRGGQEQEDTKRVKDLKTERLLSLKNEHKEMGRGKGEGVQCGKKKKMWAYKAEVCNYYYF